MYLSVRLQFILVWLVSYISLVSFFGVAANRSLKTKKKSKSQSLKVSAAAYGNVRLRECQNTEFVWELKGFKQGGRK